MIDPRLDPSRDLRVDPREYQITDPRLDPSLHPRVDPTGNPRLYLWGPRENLMGGFDEISYEISGGI